VQRAEDGLVTLAKVRSCALVGLDGELVELEVDSQQAQIPAFTVVGLPDAAVQEARERVRAAIRNSGASFSGRRITVNLAPAHPHRPSRAVQHIGDLLDDTTIAGLAQLLSMRRRAANTAPRPVAP